MAPHLNDNTIPHSPVPASLTDPAILLPLLRHLRTYPCFSEQELFYLRQLIHPLLFCVDEDPAGEKLELIRWLLGIVTLTPEHRPMVTAYLQETADSTPLRMEVCLPAARLHLPPSLLWERVLREAHHNTAALQKLLCLYPERERSMLGRLLLQESEPAALDVLEVLLSTSHVFPVSSEALTSLLTVLRSPTVSLSHQIRLLRIALKLDESVACAALETLLLSETLSDGRRTLLLDQCWCCKDLCQLHQETMMEPLRRYLTEVVEEELQKDELLGHLLPRCGLDEQHCQRLRDSYRTASPDLPCTTEAVLRCLDERIRLLREDALLEVIRRDGALAVTAVQTAITSGSLPDHQRLLLRCYQELEDPPKVVLDELEQAAGNPLLEAPSHLRRLLWEQVPLGRLERWLAEPVTIRFAAHRVRCSLLMTLCLLEELGYPAEELAERISARRHILSQAVELDGKLISNASFLRQIRPALSMDQQHLLALSLGPLQQLLIFG